MQRNDLPVYIPSTEFPTRIMIANAMNVTVYSTARVCRIGKDVGELQVAAKECSAVHRVLVFFLHLSSIGSQ